MSSNLNAEKALIFRIVHKDNVQWILSNGLHCRSSRTQAPNYRSIGNAELIERRRGRTLPIPPGGTLSDYVPFYFTPYSPMMLNIKTGYAGVTKVPNADIVILVSSLNNLVNLGGQFIFTDRHAYLQQANFYSDLESLGQIDWMILQNRDFKRDPDDPEKLERYQAEALVYDHLPVEALIGAVCYTDDVLGEIQQMVDVGKLELKVVKRTGWYF